MKQKTVFIYVNHGFAVRYLLRSKIISTIEEAGHKLVIFSPNGDEPLFRENFESNNVVVEKIDHNAYRDYMNHSKLQRICIQMRAYVMNGKYNTRTTDDFRAIFIEQNNWTEDHGIMAWLKGATWELASNILKSSVTLRKLLIGFEKTLFTPDIHRDLFEKYMPDLVVLTALCGFEYNEFFAREAMANNVPTCTVVLSWDNSSGMGMPGYDPDYVVAWSKSMKNELIELNDIDSKKIFIGGVAHFDPYYDESMFLKKEELFETLGLDITKKTIFYATKSPKRFPWGPELLEELAQAVNIGEIKGDPQILVRVHPLHYRTENGKLLFEDIIKKYEEIGFKYSNVIINIPKTSSKKIDFDLAESENILVASILKHSDVMVNMFSTMVLEASIFQLPSINICIREKCKADFGKSRQDIMVDYVQSHNQRVIQTGGVRTVFTMNELFDAINSYIENPVLDAEKRDLIVDNELGPNRGTAGAAVGSYIAGLLNQ